MQEPNLTTDFRSKSLEYASLRDAVSDMFLKAKCKEDKCIYLKQVWTFERLRKRFATLHHKQHNTLNLFDNK